MKSGVFDAYCRTLVKSIITEGTRVKRSGKGKADLDKCDTGKYKN